MYDVLEKVRKWSGAWSGVFAEGFSHTPTLRCEAVFSGRVRKGLYAALKSDISFAVLRKFPLATVATLYLFVFVFQPLTLFACTSTSSQVIDLLWFDRHHGELFL